MTTNNNVTIFVDGDETLVRTIRLSSNEALPANASEFVFMGCRWATRARPSALAFLEEAGHRWNNNVYMLTLGHPELQARVLRMHGLHSLIKDIYGARDPKAVRGKRWVLVDDLPLRSAGLEFKLERLGIMRSSLTHREWRAITARHLVHCKAFVGGDDLRPLTGLFTRIEQKLALQG